MTRQDKRRVLVLDADMVPALTILRSLSRRGCAVDLAGHTVKPIASYSNRVESLYVCPDPLSAEKDYLSWLVRHTKSHEYDLVVPVTERTLVPISNNRELFSHVKIAMPSAHSLELALDKEQTMALAEQVGVPVPGGVAISSMDDLDKCLAQLSYPVVLKPARSLGIKAGGASQLKVSYAFDEIGLRAGCEHGLKFGPMLLQEYFPGKGVGIELIAQAGKIAYAFQHLRLHEVPLTGGGSSLRKSEPLEPELLAASQRLIEALDWNGVAMVEFKWDPETRSFSLMEINGRFWGSLPLADAAGADFPSMLLDLELEGTINPCEDYRPDIYCRKLSSDLYWYEAVMRHGADSRIVDLPGTMAILRELGLFLSLRHYFDVQSLRDPKPGLVDIGRIIRSYSHRVPVLLGEKIFLWRQARRWHRGEVAKAIGNSNSILFMCYGNINRSALADELLTAYAEDSGVLVTSAGFHPETGRPADPIMVEVAGGHGVDLSRSRSTIVSPELLAESDVIFAMEKSHVDQLLEIDGSCKEKIFLLGAQGAGYPAEIGDPYGRSRANYESCFLHIAQAIDGIKTVLAYRRSE